MQRATFYCFPLTFVLFLITYISTEIAISWNLCVTCCAANINNKWLTFSVSVVTYSSKWYFAGWKETMLILKKHWFFWQKRLAVRDKATRKTVTLGNKANYFRYFLNSSPYSKKDIFQKQKHFTNVFTINSLMSKGYCCGSTQVKASVQR